MSGAGAIVKRLGAGIGASLFIFSLLVFGPRLAVYAQTSNTAGSLQSQIDAQNTQIAQLTAEIAQYQTEIATAKVNKQTLQNALNSLNAQLAQVKVQAQVTQHQITITNLKITQLGSSIADAQSAIDADSSALAENIRSLVETDDLPPLVQLISSGSLAQAWQDADQVIQVQGGIQGQITALASQKQQLGVAKSQSEAQQATLTAQKQQLTTQQKSISQTASSKSQLLVETSSQEATYEKLLAAAQAELQSFSAFANNAGGKGILYNQTSCDSWGCYYNQRDSQWGNNPLDGTQYTMKSDGCLVTTMAMVMTHYGYSGVTPTTINSNPADFAAYYPADLLVDNVSIAGAAVSRVSVGIRQANMDAVLATGNPLVVGIHAYGGTHYIVFTSGARGKYLMRDPYQPNAKDVPFTQYYSLSDIFYAAKVVIS
ncbi:MAG: C39 family peptidase [Minisyncoccia bacterium]